MRTVLFALMFVGLSSLSSLSNVVTPVLADPPGAGAGGIGGGNLPPEIQAGYCTSLGYGGYWNIGGYATDDASLEGCLVTISGPGFSTYTVCNSDGLFGVTVQLPPGTSGTITITVYDLGGASDTYYDFIDS